jgi:hypothetical protein
MAYPTVTAPGVQVQACLACACNHSHRRLGWAAFVSVCLQAKHEQTRQRDYIPSVCTFRVRAESIPALAAS